MATVAHPRTLTLLAVMFASSCATTPSPPPLKPDDAARIEVTRRREVLARWLEGDFVAADADGNPGARWAVRKLPEFAVAFYAERFPAAGAITPDAQEILMLHVGQTAIEVETWRPTRPAEMAGDTARPVDLANQFLYDVRAVPGCLTPIVWNESEAAFAGTSPDACKEPYAATWRITADGLERNGVVYKRTEEAAQ